jgi:hypothetical protein
MPTATPALELADILRARGADYAEDRKSVV